MPKRPHHPIRREIEHEDEDRRQFEADAISRQSNVLPLDAARNEGRFYGQLIRGERQLNGVQRIGFFLVGVDILLVGNLIVYGYFPSSPRFHRAALPAKRQTHSAVASSICFACIIVGAEGHGHGCRASTTQALICQVIGHLPCPEFHMYDKCVNQDLGFNLF
jgi:hypothetical protein